ncbi:hypothetical protein J1907_03165 [Lysinibacillus sphaericus]|uniref:hypothetical protein n=1 Tax=Lysinibacillus sphaericus TaxID=1421 RepID=UPI00055A90CB|nr:hypothetical protein [Lysinibacillus sphaericus]QTB23128.1 hypothetical protein J1907_03165 [Lysinibacillus sphaericus]
MKKFALSLVLSLFAVGTLGNTAMASTEVIESPSKILSEVEEIANNSESIELINIDELPEGIPFVNFDTVEDFEKAVKEMDIEATQVTVNENTESITQSNQLMGARVARAATSETTDRLRVLVKASWNPIKAATQPAWVDVDLKYTYTGSGSSKTFSELKKVTSFSLSFPTEWVQTEKNHSFYNFKKGISVELLGYNLLGAVIAGQPVGAKVKDEIKFNYVIDGSKELFGF